MTDKKHANTKSYGFLSRLKTHIPFYSGRTFKKTESDTKPTYVNKYKPQPASPLTKRILGVNLIALMLLGIGFLYLGHYQKELVSKEISLLSAEAQLFATAFLNLDQSQTLKTNTRFERLNAELALSAKRKAIVFDGSGTLIANSERIFGFDSVVNKQDVIDFKNQTSLSRSIKIVTRLLLNLFPGGDVQRLKLYPYTLSEDIRAFPVAQDALNSTLPSFAVWRSLKDDIILSAAVPIMKKEQLFGVVMLEKGGENIQDAVNALRMDVLIVFLIGLFVTIILSFYLAGTIAHPLRRLAWAADEVRRSKKRHTDIPDFSIRQDEIAMVSESLRDMTEALWDRMDAIESFAADVSHELKNPLTSLKSAIETASRVTDMDKRDKLMKIIDHDIQRLDRLITDISEASRIDASLSKTEMQPCQLNDILTQAVKLSVRIDDPRNISFNLDLRVSNAMILAIDTRIMQVIQNLIDNALTFSPEGGIIDIVLKQDMEKKNYVVQVADQGPGIPLENLDRIFERFYTERPSNESFGNHSGLGLSIVKQIVEAHNGTITVNNLYDRQGQIRGCEFLALFPILSA